MYQASWNVKFRRLFVTEWIMIKSKNLLNLTRWEGVFCGRRRNRKREHDGT